MVVDRELKAEALVGYVDKQSIDQAVVDAMRESGGLMSDRYLREVNSVCASTGRLSFAVADPNSAGQAPAYVSDQRSVVRRLDTRFAGIKAPAKHRGFKRATMRDHAAFLALITEWGAYLGSKPSATRVMSSVAKFSPREAKLAKRYNARMDRHDVLSCGSNA